MTGQVFTLPDLGEGLREAELVHWLVGVGDPVAVDAPIAEVETAKAMLEIPSPYGGVVERLHAAEGSVVQVGAPLISVTPDESRNVLVGYGPTAAPTGRRTRPSRGRTAQAGHGQPGQGRAGHGRAASPVVRKLAKAHGIDLAALPGTGPDGLVTRADVERAAAARRPAADERTGLAIAERVRTTGTRRAIADAMARSRREIPEATIWADVDVTALRDARARMRDVGLLALVARFVVAGLARFPDLNARLDGESGDVLRWHGVNLGIATQTDRGLLVPAVAAAHTLTTRQLDAEIRRLTTAAREGRATPAELTRGSFTLNNYGRFGVDGSAAVINHPEVAILGIGRIMPRPWVVDGAIAVRDVTQLSLVFDHRVCDGETAAGLLRFVADAMEAPATVLADL